MERQVALFLTSGLIGLVHGLLHGSTHTYPTPEDPHLKNFYTGELLIAMTLASTTNYVISKVADLANQPTFYEVVGEGTVATVCYGAAKIVGNGLGNLYHLLKS
jgi:hypothetical protein